MEFLTLIESLAKFIGIAEYIDKLAISWQAKRKQKEAVNAVPLTKQQEISDIDNLP